MRGRKSWKGFWTYARCLSLRSVRITGPLQCCLFGGIQQNNLNIKTEIKINEQFLVHLKIFISSFWCSVFYFKHIHKKPHTKTSSFVFFLLDFRLRKVSTFFTQKSIIASISSQIISKWKYGTNVRSGSGNYDWRFRVFLRVNRKWRKKDFPLE